MEEDLMGDFLVECTELLEQLDSDVVELEKNPEDGEIIKRVFRSIHTIKGTSGFFELNRLEKIAHTAENILDKMRDGDLPVTPENLGPVFEGVDEIRKILESLEESREEPEGDDTELLKKLEAVLEGGGSTSSASADKQKDDASQDEGASVGGLFSPEIEAALTAKKRGSALPKSEVVAQPPGKPASPQPPKKDGSKKGAKAKDAGKKSAVEQSLRVNIDVLEEIMNLVGELVLTRNQLTQLVKTEENVRFTTPVHQLTRVTSNLQESVVKTRMQPIGTAWSKVPRLVRDLTQSSGKKIELIMNGQETELDRTIHQAIQDPLTHMIRNSADHGIESPEDRVAAGKSEAGTIKLNAFHEGGFIVIEVSDDGKGIDADIIRDKAIQKGLVSEEDAFKMSNTRILDFIFDAGFSTAQQITSVSGRGVGMDVVRSNITQIGGTVELHSEVGMGTTFKIRIPLTLAIVSAFLLVMGKDHYAMPQAVVSKLVRINKDNQHLVEDIHGAKVLRLKDKLLPLLDLADVLKLEKRDPDADVNILITRAGQADYGLIVDEVLDTLEIVVKPIGRILKDINEFSGTTILGDGNVIMILDAVGIGEHIKHENLLDIDDPQNDKNDALVGSSDSIRFLLFHAGDKGIQGIPLSMVARLEEFKSSEIEQAGNRSVVQYRNKLLPLIPADDTFADQLDPQPVIVFSDKGYSVGLMVKEILDIVETPLKLEGKGKKDSVLGTAIVNGKATEVIDIQYYMNVAHPDWLTNSNGSVTQEKKRILMVDDSQLFLDLMRSSLEMAGFEVTQAISGKEALEVLKIDTSFDLILSDITMPEMDGFEFAEAVRANQKTKEMPLVALTAVDSEAEREKGKVVGFDDYLIKLDKKKMIDGIQSFLESREHVVQ